MSGRFIVLEGLDGAGTTTQSRLLVDWLGVRGEVLLTREPTDRAVGGVIRKVLVGAEGAPDWRALPWLFAADRADHIFSEIDPALARGATVVSDRYYHSSLAYQSLTMPLEQVASLNSFRAPDLTLFVDLPVERCLDRITSRGRTREIFEHRERLTAISSGYAVVLDYLQARGERITSIDGDRPVEDVFSDIRAAVVALES